MRREILWTAAFLLLGGMSLARAEEPTNSDTPDTAPTAASADPSDASSPAATGEKWRYRRHQGMWWYWLPSNKWVYWSDDKWVPYDPATYAELQASRPQRSYSYNRSGNGYGGSNWGKWGPVRYNGYGQVEYPYSRRKSGIKQLGPVPAMGGVRAMPGWGGER